MNSKKGIHNKDENIKPEEIKEKFRFKYHKLTLMLIFIILAYFIFSNEKVAWLFSHIGSTGYLIMFLAGILFSYGFSAPFSVGFFIVSEPQNIFLASVIAGLGALISDILIFRLIRFFMIEEFVEIEKIKPVKGVEAIIEGLKIEKKIKNYIIAVFAGIIIASPLPDEIGVSMLAGFTQIKQSTFMVISFILNTIGILVILLLNH